MRRCGSPGHAQLTENAIKGLMEVKRRGSRYRDFTTAAALVLCVAACSRPPAATSPPQSSYAAANTCAGCHAEIAKRYRQTGMGRSFYRPSAANIVEDYAKRNQL